MQMNYEAAGIMHDRSVRLYGVGQPVNTDISWIGERLGKSNICRQPITGGYHATVIETGTPGIWYSALQKAQRNIPLEAIQEGFLRLREDFSDLPSESRVARVKDLRVLGTNATLALILELDPEWKSLRNDLVQRVVAMAKRLKIHNYREVFKCDEKLARLLAPAVWHVAVGRSFRIGTKPLLEKIHPHGLKLELGAPEIWDGRSYYVDPPKHRKIS